MSILNYFKKLDNKLTPKSENDISRAVLGEKKQLNENNSPKNSVASKEKVKKKLDLKDEENSIKKEAKENVCDVDMKSDVDNDDQDDEAIVRVKKETKLTSKDSPRNVKRKRVLLLGSDSDEADADSDKEIKLMSAKKKKKTQKEESDYEAEQSDEDDDDDFDDDDEDDDEEDSFIDDSDNVDIKKKKKKKGNNTKSNQIKSKPVSKKTVLSHLNVASSSYSSPKSSPKSSRASPACSPATKSALNAFAATTSNYDDDLGIETGKFKHMTYSFLEDDKIRDINMRKKSDPDYDPRTIYVPPEFKKTLTPALRQWWELKSTNFDVLFFFKVGKFYELYHQDAMIAVKELGLTFMKGDYAHCGFPEIAFSRFADALVSKGYKVGRVEQTETPEMMTERVKGTRQDKTVRREICRITTPGTKTFNLLDSEVSSAFSNYLFALVEKADASTLTRKFGVCFVDTSVGKLQIGQFEDDRNCSKLRTTFAHYPPAHILYEKSNLSKETKHIIDLQNGIKEPLYHEKEMMSSATLLRLLAEGDYFKETEFEWPASFRPLLSEYDTLGLTANSKYELALNAMGGIVWCLKKCLIDNEILSMKNFEIYEPVDNTLTSEMQMSDEMRQQLCKQRYMVLDSISLTNLEVIENNFDCSQKGTLYEQLDYCCTQFGKRLLKYWIVSPLCDPEAINDRLDAIEDLMTLDEQLDRACDMFKTLPDLERLISKTHQLGNIRADHPDSRAIMYENITYGKKKVEDFVQMLSGFATSVKLLNSFGECSKKFKSKLLKSILTINKETTSSKNKLNFPYMDELLDFYSKSFDAEQAKRDGKIIPSKGVSEDYDQAMSDIKQTQRELDAYLQEQSRVFNCKIIYFGTAKNRYQLEIAESRCKNVPDDFELISTKKGFKRYWSNVTKKLFSKMTDAESRRDQALRDTMKCLFKNFDNHYDVWNRAVHCLSILDVLMSLTRYTKRAENTMCRPELVLLDMNDKAAAHKPFIEIREGRHPCLTRTFGGDFVPNDVVIGCEEAEERWQRNPLVLVTGPNMGGKSTLMRQTGLTLILAQMGCYVPAEKCRFSPVDRIFTRIGASDKILAGESTFFMELSETASILRHASKHSLVLMDELGRGTATFDGTAIAYSVVKELAQSINCRTLFSTHYHHLVEEFQEVDNVSMGHMQCMVNDDDQSITFLYKFGDGACPKSHGFNAARLADIPDAIIKVGTQKSIEFEHFTQRIQLLKKLMHSTTKKEIGDVLTKFKALKAC